MRFEEAVDIFVWYLVTRHRAHPGTGDAVIMKAFFLGE
jgi:hypothetical protein